MESTWLVLVFIFQLVALSLARSLLSFQNSSIATIQSPDGDIIDCVMLTQQPAFSHPLIKNTKIQMFPSIFSSTNEPTKADDGSSELQQVWQQAGQSCPVGTVPIRRYNAQVADLKPHSRKFLSATNLTEEKMVIGGIDHQYAIVSTDGTFRGSSGNLNVWNPTVESDIEFSLGQTWIYSGTWGTDLNTIEAGWHVYPTLYNDRKARLFIFWTADSYRTTGCYNLLCQGFVQINKDVVIGGAFHPISTYHGDQFGFDLLIFKDPVSGNWWMRLNGKFLGYWPSQLFSHLADSATTTVQWGGEIVNSQPNNRHTMTQMGSGRFPQEGPKAASYVWNLQVVDLDNKLKIPEKFNTMASNPGCYDISQGEFSNKYFFGGPGFNSKCP